MAIEQLSPSTRGIVLLLLYLAADRNDHRPLIIDQPEENLDPHSVFTELVPHFREARKPRQIIVVSDNANLIVNTDADQVIIAYAQRVVGRSLPTMSYQSGALENPKIGTRVCETLEGGEYFSSASGDTDFDGVKTASDGSVEWPAASFRRPVTSELPQERR